MTNARDVLQNYEDLCSSLSEIISAFGVIFYDHPKTQQKLLRQLSFFKLRSKMVLSTIEFINNYRILGKAHCKHRVLRPPIVDKRPVYSYNRLQTDLYRHIGLERVHLLKGRAMQFKILQDFKDLSLLPGEVREIIDLIEEKRISPSTTGYDAHVLALYFERISGVEDDNAYRYQSPQMEFTFGELDTYGKTLAHLPNYFDLSSFDRDNMTRWTGLSGKKLSYILARQQFFAPVLRTMLDAIQFEL